MATPRPDASFSHLAAVLLIATTVLAAPSLFEYVLQLTLPLFGGLLSHAADSALPQDLWFSVGTPLLKVLGALLLLAIMAAAGAVSIRRALSR